jgi:chemotaxis protein CheX
VLKIQCFLEAKTGKPFLKKPTDPLLLGDLSGIIGITSEVFSGTLAISFPEPLFLKIAENMLGEKHSQITAGIVDIAGELSNMILGQAKIELNNLGFQVQQALPSCIWGKDHKVKHFGGGACIVLPFETAHGVFHVEVSTNQALLSSKPKPAEPAAGAGADPAPAAASGPAAAEPAEAPAAAAPKAGEPKAA